MYFIIVVTRSKLLYSENTEPAGGRRIGFRNPLTLIWEASLKGLKWERSYLWRSIPWCPWEDSKLLGPVWASEKWFCKEIRTIHQLGLEEQKWGRGPGKLGVSSICSSLPSALPSATFLSKTSKNVVRILAPVYIDKMKAPSYWVLFFLPWERNSCRWWNLFFAGPMTLEAYRL